MKDILEFGKLFKLNFPIVENFEYYVDVLKKSPEYSEWLDDMILDFGNFEKDVESMGYKSIKSYKLDFALPRMKEYILNTNAYKNFQQTSLPKDFLVTKDDLRKNDEEILLSIDFNAANFNTLKFYDENNELGEFWDELCDKMDIHPTLSKSKSFRQYVFGNTSPGRLQKIQHININKIVNELHKQGMSDKDFVFISHDEIIIKISPDKSIACNQVDYITQKVQKIIDENNIRMKIHYKVFKNSSLGKGMCVQTVYNVKLTGLSEMYNTLFKVPGNMFYFYFKKYILECELDDRDLYFTVDGKLAQWVV